VSGACAAGTLQRLGGMTAGHKAYGLALRVDAPAPDHASRRIVGNARSA